MATIGYSGGTGFIGGPANNTQALANKFTAPSTFTPIEFFIKFSESWGVGGTLRIAIYTDNSGAPDTKIMEGSVAYSSLTSGWHQVTIDTPAELTNATDYWLAAQWENSSGTFNIDTDEASDGSFTINKWTESGHSWTDAPTITGTDGSRKMGIYATDTVTTSSKRNARIKGLTTTTSARSAKTKGTGIISDNRNARIVSKDTTSANRNARIFGGYAFTHQDEYDNTDNYDAGNSSNVEWDGDGSVKLRST